MEGPALTRRAALAVAALTLTAVVSIALLPARSHGVMLSSINQKIESTRNKLEHARGHEQVLTSDISALSSRIGTL